MIKSALLNTQPILLLKMPVLTEACLAKIIGTYLLQIVNKHCKLIIEFVT